MKDCNNGINFIILATVISIVIVKILDINQQNVFGNFLQAIGSNISTIAAYDEYINTLSENAVDSASDNNSNELVKPNACDKVIDKEAKN